MNALALILARGGSKGIPGKNIRPLSGRPLIVWSIDVALRSPSIATVVVSTDSPEIAEVARSAGARVPFLRPATLATDTALQIDAMQHAVTHLETQGERYPIVVLLQPTSPLRTVDEVEGAVGLLAGTGADSVIAVTEVTSQHPMIMYRMDPAQRLSSLLPSDGAGVRRQDFPKVYLRTGAVYATRRDVLMQQRSLYGHDSRGYVMPEERSVNIDSPMDWELAEFYLARHGVETTP